MIGWTLCSGIGAPEVAAPWVDWRLASEIEPAPRAVLQHRFGYRQPEDHSQGDPLLWGDMTEVTPELARSRGVPLPDLLVAGTPCQAFSIAGLRGGTADARGNLTLKFVETCHAIVDARPDGKLAVLWENVPGVLSDTTNAFGCFLAGIVGGMDELLPPEREWGFRHESEWFTEAGDDDDDPVRIEKATVGGTWGWQRISWPGEGMVQGPRARAAWAVLDAQWFGLAQRRRRVFVVIDFGGACDPAQVLLEPDSLRGDHPPSREAGKDIAGPAGTGASHWSGGPHPALNQSHNTGGIGASNQELFSQGGAGLVQGHHGDVAGTVSSKWSKGSGGPAGDETQNMVAFDCKGTEVQHDSSGVSPPLRSMGHSNSHQNAGGHAAVAIQERAGAADLSTGPQGAGYRTDDCAYTLEARNKVQSVAFDLRGRDEGAQVESIGETVSLRAAEGGSSRSYVAVGGDTTHSLTGEGHDASEDGTGRATPVVAFAQNTRDEVRQINGDGTIAGALAAETGAKQQTYLACGPIVRRLMPVECDRLQGFPDHHGQVPFRGKPMADGNLYKMAGNSMAVPVIKYILERVKESSDAVRR